MSGRSGACAEGGVGRRGGGGGEEGARPGTAGSRRRRPSERRRDASARLTPFDPRTRSPVVHSIVSYRVSLVSLCLRSSREKERERGGGFLLEGRKARRADSRSGRLETCRPV